MKISHIPHWHTDSEQVDKRLSPTSSKSLHSDLVFTQDKPGHNWNFPVDLTRAAADSNIYGFTPTY